MSRQSNYIIKRSKVLSVEDNSDGLRVKVRLFPEDNQTSDDNDLPYCFPLLPKLLHVNPKVGESVLVILAREDDSLGDRYFIGPVIAQPQNLEFASHESGAYTLMEGSPVAPKPAPSNNPENLGSFPERDDISIRGRENTDIILKSNEVRTRCGIHKQGVSNKLAYNDENIGYIQQKWTNGLEDEGRSFNSVTNVVSDKINLLSYQSIDNFDLANKDCITNDELMKVLQEAHKLPYGDLLIKFLSLFIKAFVNHTHAYPGLPTLLTNEVETVANYDLDSILCESIRIS